MNDYLNKHAVLVSKTLGSVLADSTYDKGLVEGGPGAPESFVAIAYLFFNAMKEFGASFRTSVPVNMEDMANCTI